jgi:carbon-monoxide dehydrogenase medium subunit
LQTPAAFEYERATSVDGAIASLQRLGSEARIIAGGHSRLRERRLHVTVKP